MFGISHAIIAIRYYFECKSKRVEYDLFKEALNDELEAQQAVIDSAHGPDALRSIQSSRLRVYSSARRAAQHRLEGTNA